MNMNNRLNLDNIVFSLVSQNFDSRNSKKIKDVKGTIYEEFNNVNTEELITPDMKVGITVGSRGIANIVTIIKTICNYVREKGGKPFIIPAMGSHGGASAQGQLDVLNELGITEGTMDCPIESSMEVVQLGTTESGVPVYFDKFAYSLDGIVVVNRIKPHTDFDAEIESGLTKMIAVGLGNEMGCSTMHAYGLSKSIPESAKISMGKANILMGLGIIENSKDETYKLKALLPEDFEVEERKLLIEAKNIVPKLPVDNLDILVVEEIGKMISGTGMDTKVIGRIKIQGEEDPLNPKIKKIVVLNLAKNSYGNALGIGLADITTKKLLDSIDFDATYANIIATAFLERGKIPIVSSDDRNAITIGVNTVGNIDPKDIKIGIIKNTLDLQEMYLSDGALKEIDRSRIEVIEKDIKLSFDEDGNLII